MERLLGETVALRKQVKEGVGMRARVTTSLRGGSLLRLLRSRGIVRNDVGRAGAFGPRTTRFCPRAKFRHRWHRAQEASCVATFAHKLNHGPLQCGQCAFDKHCLLLEVQQKIIPHRLLGQHFRVAQHDETKSRARQGNIEAARIGKEADALPLIRADTPWV